MAIELGPGREDIIKVRKGDNINALVDEFCLKHNLKSSLKPKLIEQIRSNLSEQPSSADITDEENNSETVYQGGESILMPHDTISPKRQEFSPSRVELNPEPEIDKTFDDNEKSDIKFEMLEKKQLNKTHHGVILYEKGMKQKEELERQRRKEIELREKNEILGVTFKPSINNTPLKTSSGKVVERLLKNGVQTEQRKERIRSENVVMSAVKFNYSPNINQKYNILL